MPQRLNSALIVSKETFSGCGVAGSGIETPCHRVGHIKIAPPGDNPFAKHTARQPNPHVNSPFHARRSSFQHSWLRRGRRRGRRGGILPFNCPCVERRGRVRPARDRAWR